MSREKDISSLVESRVESLHIMYIRIFKLILFPLLFSFSTSLSSLFCHFSLDVGSVVDGYGIDVRNPKNVSYKYTR